MPEDDRSKDPERTCFVIGPIGSRLAPIGTPARSQYETSQNLWENVIEPACAEFGLTPLRADRLAQPGEITEQIFVLLRDADIVIADLSGGNANVMYELGLRHTRNLPTIQIGEYERLPFDVNTIRTIQFRRTEAGLVDARGAFIEALRSALNGEATAVTASRVWDEGPPATPEVLALAIQRSSETVEEPDDDGPGVVEMLAEGEEAMQRLTESLEPAAEALGEIGNLLTDAAQKIGRSDAQRGGFAGRLKIANELAQALADPTELMTERIADFFVKVGKVDAAVMYILDELASEPERGDEARELIESLIGLVDAAEESLEGAGAMLEMATAMPKLSRALAPPAKTIRRGIGQYVEGVDVMLKWRDAVRRLEGGESAS